MRLSPLVKYIPNGSEHIALHRNVIKGQKYQYQEYALIFNNPQDEQQQALFLDYYYPKSYWDRMEHQDTHFSRQILELKNNNRAAALFFLNRIRALLGKDFTVVVVPQHTANTNPSATQKTGIALLAQSLTLENSGIVDGTNCLVRWDTVDKLSRGGNRNIHVHLNSIRVESAHLIKDRQVLILDDVRTTGNSCDACNRLLSQEGARIIKTLVLGQTAYPRQI